MASNKWLTIKYVYRNRRRVCVVGHTSVIPGVGEGSFRHQELAGGAAFSLLRFQTDTAAWRVEVDDGVPVVPEGTVTVKKIHNHQLLDVRHIFVDRHAWG